MALDRDPKALSILLRNQPQIPQKSEEDYALESMIPEEQLFQAQEAYGQHGAQSGGAYSIPSRQALQQSGMAELRKLFGIQRGEAEAKALPARIAGEYGLETARTKGGFDVESAKQKAIADAAARSQQQEFQTQQQGRQQEFQSGQGNLNREAVERNTQSNIAGRQNVANTTSTRAAATQQAITDRKTGGKNEYWGPEALGPTLAPLWNRLFGGADPAATAPPSPAAAELAPLINSPQYSALPFESLVQQGIVSGSPDEIEAYRQAWESR